MPRLGKLPAAMIPTWLDISHASFAEDGTQQGVLRYCERFAQATPGKLLKMDSARYVAGSARVSQSRLGNLVTAVTNLFQPRDSRLGSVWQCEFSIMMNGRLCEGEGEVALPVAEHAAVAEYTHWPGLDIVGGREIVSEEGERIGYATPKYFETTCDGDHR